MAVRLAGSLFAASAAGAGCPGRPDTRQVRRATAPEPRSDSWLAQQPGLERPGGDLDPVTQPELGLNARNVAFHGAKRDEQLSTDFGIGAAAGDRLGHVDLPGRQPLRGIAVSRS